jgi:hypothetical protein
MENQEEGRLCKSTTYIENLCNTNVDCWEAVLNLYAITEEQIHSLVHLNLLCDDKSFSLSGYRVDVVKHENITKPQHHSHISIAQIEGKVVIAEGMSNRQADHLKCELNQLKPHTKHLNLGAKNACRPVNDGATIQPNDSGTLTDEFTKIKQKGDERAPDSLFDPCLNQTSIDRNFEANQEETLDHRSELETHVLQH